MLSIAIVLRVLAIASVVACGMFETAAFAWVPIAAIGLATVLGVAKNRTDPDKLNEIAEQVYFLGYLSTIAAFAAAVLNVYRQGHIPEKPFALLLMVAIALMTTVAGLLCMTAIKEYSSTLPKQDSSEPDLSEFLQALKTLARAAELATATRSLADFIETKEKLLGDLSAAADEAKTVQKTLTSLCIQITKADEAFQQVSSSADASRRDVREVNQVLEKFVTSLGQQLHDNGSDHRG